MNLKEAQIVGFVSLPTAEGTCFHCGMGIKHCVIVIDPQTGKEVSIGTTCGERVGLDPTQLRNKETTAQRKLREAAQADREQSQADRNAPIIKARQEKRAARALELQPIVNRLRKLDSDFCDSLAAQLEGSQSLSYKQALCLCAAFSVTGRRNKKNQADWDATLDVLCPE